MTVQVGGALWACDCSLDDVSFVWDKDTPVFRDAKISSLSVWRVLRRGKNIRLSPALMEKLKAKIREAVTAVRMQEEAAERAKIDQWLKRGK